MSDTGPHVTALLRTMPTDVLFNDPPNPVHAASAWCSKRGIYPTLLDLVAERRRRVAATTREE